MWLPKNTIILVLILIITTTKTFCAKNEVLRPPATSYGIPDYRQTRSFDDSGDYTSNDLVGLSTDLSGITTSYRPLASGIDESLTTISDIDNLSRNANAYSSPFTSFTNYGGDLSALQSVQQVPVLTAYQQIQQVPVISNIQTVQQVPVVAASVQQPVVLPATGIEGRSLGGAGIGAGIGGLAGAGFGGGFKRYRTSVHIRSRGFGGGLGGFGGLGGLGGFKGFGGGFGGGHIKAHYSESGGGGFAGAGGAGGAGLFGGAAGGLFG